MRAAALDTLDRAPLDPTKPFKDEREIAMHWDDLQRSSPNASAYEVELAKQWQQIGCGSDGAPYLLKGLIQRLKNKNFSADSSKRSQLAAEFLKGDCAGARGLPEDDRTILETLRTGAQP